MCRYVAGGGTVLWEEASGRGGLGETDELVEAAHQLSTVHHFAHRQEDAWHEGLAASGVVADGEGLPQTAEDDLLVGHQTGKTRSEERRVGKECRSRWAPYH